MLRSLSDPEIHQEKHAQNGRNRDEREQGRKNEGREQGKRRQNGEQQTAGKSIEQGKVSESRLNVRGEFCSSRKKQGNYSPGNAGTEQLSWWGKKPLREEG